jgi:hypothetical protein
MAATPNTNGGSPGNAYDPYQQGPNDSDQWIRRWSLVLSGAGGQQQIISQDALNIPQVGTENEAYADGLRVTFRITQNMVGSPGKATIRIFNTLLTTPLTTNQAASSRPTDAPGSVTVFNGPNAGVSYFADVSADGQYDIWSIEYEGDSRGKSWYCHLKCVAHGQNPPPGATSLTNAIQPGTQGPTQGQIANLNDQTAGR